MSRHQIKDETFQVPSNFRGDFKSNIVTHTALTSEKSRLDNNKLNLVNHENDLLDWINQTLEDKAKEIYKRNENLAAGSTQNAHRNAHNKNQGTKQPKVTGSVYDSLMNESLNNEINEIKYLIGYLTNNNDNNMI